MKKSLWSLLLAGSVFGAYAAEYEFESGKSETRGAAVVNQEKASGGKVVEMRGFATNSVRKPKADSPADWMLVIPSEKAAGYQVQMKFYSPDTSSDSVYWSLNGEKPQECHVGIHPDGRTVNLGVVRFNKGDNVFRFWTRETRLQLDKMILTEKQLPRPRKDISMDQVTFNSDRAERTADGIRLKAGVKAEPGAADKKGDVEFSVKLPEGRYWINTLTACTMEEYNRIKKINKFGSPRADVSVGNTVKTQLCIFVAWHKPESSFQRLGKFTFDGTTQTVKFFLPPEITLKKIEIVPYTPPAVPKEVQRFRPQILPPKDRPRLLMTSDILPQIRKNLTIGENAEVWQYVQNLASNPLTVKIGPRGYDSNVEYRIVTKAFVALMKQDKIMAREAIEAMDKYLQLVNYGNMLDITREIGAAIYSASYVYDWCYSEMKPEERDRIRANMMQLADDMECGWPPFLQHIVTGHGNEHQMNRDLFSMAVAIYDEDPVPYNIISYRMLKELSPVHTYEYGAGRHNQGMSYGLSRFACDMFGAWNAKRTWKIKLFGDTILRVPYQWIYMRLPNGELMRDGDDWIATQQGGFWNCAETLFLCYTYGNDPIQKGEMFRIPNFKPRYYGYRFLLFNDPNVKAEPDRSGLPLTYVCKDPYPSMIARTGWDFGPQANDAIVFLTGAGLQCGGHQHLNSGDFQIYYRGILAADLGTYFYYGTPYDIQFNKQSISHNVMLFRDPNDPRDNGGQTYKGYAVTLDTMERIRCGHTLASAVGPDSKLPMYSYLKTDLKKAYPNGKLAAYERAVYVLNNADAEAPMTVIVADHVKADRKYLKYWQLNSFTEPKAAGNAFEVLSLNGEGKLTLFPVYPKVSHEILSGKASHSVWGKQYEAPKPKMPEANGSRLMLTPVKPAEEEVFLNVMQLTRSGRTAVKPEVTKISGGAERITAGPWIVVRSPSGKTLDGVTVKAAVGKNVLISDLKPGKYSVSGLGGAEVKQDGVLFFRAGKAGKYTVAPVGRITRKIDNSKVLAPKVKPTSIDFK